MAGCLYAKRPQRIKDMKVRYGGGRRYKHDIPVTELIDVFLWTLII